MNKLIKNIGLLIMVLGISNSLNAQDIQSNQNRHTATTQQNIPGTIMPVSEQDINALPEHATVRIKPVEQNENLIGKAYFITPEEAKKVLVEKAQLRAIETQEITTEGKKEILPIINEINKNEGGQ